MALVRTSGPTIEPVSVTEAKAHCRVDVTDDDTLIAALITAAREHIETITQPRMALVNETWKLALDTLPVGDTLVLPVVPLSSVTSVVATDDAGVAATLASSEYLVDTYSIPGRIRLKSDADWVASGTTLRELNGFEVTFVAGYGSAASAVPQTIRQAILMLVGHWYENREDQVASGTVPKALDFAVKALVAPYRKGAH